MSRVPVLRRRRRAPARRSGQTLVEFALVFPIFFTLLLGILEFAFAFNAILSVNFASRNASLFAAEAGSGSGADCVVLARIEDDVTAPADASRINSVEIYRAKSNGDDYVPAERTVFSRTGSMTCSMPDGSTSTVPYTRTSNGYPELSRCNFLGGCGGTHTSVDHIGVRIDYTHTYVTPLQNFIGSGSGFTFERANVMRMEPIL
jgi:Flp pilus assembly protein TadG